MSIGEPIDLVILSIENESLPSHLLVSREIEELVKVNSSTPLTYDESLTYCVRWPRNHLTLALRLRCVVFAVVYVL